jgi:hypothetical protein
MAAKSLSDQTRCEPRVERLVKLVGKPSTNHLAAPNSAEERSRRLLGPRLICHLVMEI